MKEKLLAQLIIKYPGVSKKFLGLFAEKQSTKVTDETQIEGVINELDNLPISIPELAVEWQKDGDARVIEAKQQWSKTPPKPDKPEKKPEPPTETPKAEEVPAWAQALIDQNKAFADRLQGIEKEKTLGTIKQQLQEKLKDVPASIWSKRQLPETPEAVEAFVADVNTDYQEDFINKGLVTNPGSGKSGKASNGKATAEEVNSIVKGIMPKV